jgi:hypothetical protein
VITPPVKSLELLGVIVIDVPEVLSKTLEQFAVLNATDEVGTVGVDVHSPNSKIVTVYESGSFEHELADGNAIGSEPQAWAIAGTDELIWIIINNGKIENFTILEKFLHCKNIRSLPRERRISSV